MSEAKTTGWLAAKIECDICTHTFVCVYPWEADDDHLECPNCGYQSTTVREYIPPKKPNK